MKKNTLLLIAALTGVVLSSSSAIAASADAPAKCDGATKKLTPVHVVHPTELPRQYENVTVQLSMTIDEKGVPRDVQAIGQMPKDLAARLLPAVAQWRFTPNYVNGRPVATRVVLPLELVEGA